MLDLYAELGRIVDALDAAGIVYALVGGVAVSIYTVPRATEDIELMIAAHDLERVVAAISAIGFRRAGRLMRIAGGRAEIQRLIKIDGSDLLPLDLLLPVDPGIAGFLEDRIMVEWEGRRISILGLSSLRALKRLRNSAQDRADLEAFGPEPA